MCLRCFFLVEIDRRNSCPVLNDAGAMAPKVAKAKGAAAKAAGVKARAKAKANGRARAGAAWGAGGVGGLGAVLAGTTGPPPVRGREDTSE